ncbi:MAG: prolipoprotein diacylglyceryl transferase [Ruminococcus sp.]|jgi:phosphatidylglycerol:prolipoprotein diacylglycerol transferase|nr:prolipoprotein diacylglyceryl transferase [Ruminococcus sp.]
MEVKSLEINNIVFPKLGIDITLNETAFTINAFGNGLDIKWYGIIITAAIMLAVIFGLCKMRAYGLDSNRAIDVIIAGIVGGIIGARTYYVLMRLEDYKSFSDVIDIRSGGLAMYGGLIGALLFGYVTAKIRKVRFLPLLDIAGMGFLMAQSIGRWGNFFNQEAFGTNTDLPWGMSGGGIQNVILSMGNSDLVWDKTVHPCFLYESLWCIAGFCLLLFYSKKRKFDGELFLMYIGWYGLGRFFIEGLRTDSLYLGNIRISQLVAAICVVLALVLIIVFRNKVKRMHGDYQFYYQTEESVNLLKEADSKNTKPKDKKTEKSDNMTTEKPNSESLDTKTDNTAENPSDEKSTAKTDNTTEKPSDENSAEKADNTTEKSSDEKNVKGE